MTYPRSGGLVALALVAVTTLPAHAQVAEIRDSYRVALDGTFAPHAMPRLSGGVEGFNVDLAQLIGERLGAGMTVDAAQFSGLIPALQAGTYDFLVAPVTVNQERAENLLFTEGFMDTNFAFVVPAGSEKRDALEDFKGMTISVNRGSAYHTYLDEHAGEYGWTVVPFGTNTDAVEAVATGRADANLSGATVAAWAALQNPAVDLSHEIETGLVWGLAFRLDDAATRNRIDLALECLKIDGSLAALSEKWFGVTPAAGTTIVTPTPGFGVPDLPGYQEDDHEPSCDFS
ncbi:transporter substrate-binding domain-containing protein [Cereibacter sediminicola]|uniref:transporter substrate-binding domain-containing protein n=1 Tax=Cereibacter sediminicola TaxID=2584941 RepID=UPI00119D2C75|nr:transporter substrate-binding domain-containing protein [Cereibacter sediminicola]